MALDLHALKQALKAYARQVGLDLVGVASAEPFEAERALLERRQAEGRGPNPFEPREIELRVYPDRLLPGARAIIAAGISYLMPEAEPAADRRHTLRGWLSRYCRGLDYHPLLRSRLNKVAAWLQEQVPGTRTLVCVDTEPPLEKAVAQRAGLGKIGKHTNLLTRPYGTWVLLGEILTDLPLPPDEPAAPACGSCTLCIDACPTQCLTPWQLDSSRCLSYITQMKGIIPPEFREVMGNRLFGCDDCQTVCPYNRRAKPGGHPEFAPNPEVGAEPDLLLIMNMTQSDFRRWFAPTAAGWRGKTTLQRNAVIALGNSGDPAALEPLARALQSESRVIRAHAAWALGRLARLAPAAAPRARELLTQRQEMEPDGLVQQEIATALESITSRIPEHKK
ncbi:MAG TPA: tRNA epoxyqueuosine(34) reductase QueG [Symbiobacteriaceae bacterium]